MDSVIMGKPIAKGIAQPGDLLYQVLTKPPPEMPKLPDLQKLGAGAAALGGLLTTVGNGSKLLNNLQKVTTLASNMRNGDSGGQSNDLKTFVSKLSSLLGGANNNKNNQANSVPKPAVQQFTQVPAAPPKGAVVPTISAPLKKPVPVPTKLAPAKPPSGPKPVPSSSKPAVANTKPSSG